jgi:Flp pilus assembly protein TadD
VNLASLAVYLQKAGEAESAARHLRDAVRGTPDDPGVWIRAAQVHAMAGRTDEALGALRRALDLGYSKSDAERTEEFDVLRGNPRLAGVFAGVPAGRP